MATASLNYSNTRPSPTLVLLFLSLLVSTLALLRLAGNGGFPYLFAMASASASHPIAASPNASIPFLDPNLKSLDQYFSRDAALPSSTCAPAKKELHLQKAKPFLRLLRPSARSLQFAELAKDFFLASSCKNRFFMTWISSSGLFGPKELLVTESLFKFHPDACLLILSAAMDSPAGAQQLRRFQDGGFRVAAVSPDFNYLLGDTPASGWVTRLQQGEVDPGYVPLGQNLSNLLRLAVLYKFGGVYLDTDVLIVRSFRGLRNAIGAQTVDTRTGKWSRLNNAVMIFDTAHPILSEFMKEFAVTFDGNMWGHNGPLLVSRVVERLGTSVEGVGIVVLPPPAFYPVDWIRIRGLFERPRDEGQAKWATSRLEAIQNESFAVHLWNKKSSGLKVEEGSVIAEIIRQFCVLCDFPVNHP